MGKNPKREPDKLSEDIMSGQSFGAGRYIEGLPDMPVEQPTAPTLELGQPPLTNIQVPGFYTGAPATIQRDGFTYRRGASDPGGTNYVDYAYDPDLTRAAMERQMAFAPNYSLFYNPAAMLEAGQPAFDSPWYHSSYGQTPQGILGAQEPAQILRPGPEPMDRINRIAELIPYLRRK